MDKCSKANKSQRLIIGVAPHYGPPVKMGRDGADLGNLNAGSDEPVA